MKIQDLRNLTVDELTAQRAERKQELVNLRIQAQLGQLENPARIRQLRREVARIETLLAERSRSVA
jgi:large subunit ribosomal protein L29